MGPGGRIAQAAEQAAEESIVKMVLGRVTRVRLLFGPPTDAISRVAARSGAVAAAYEEFAEAHWRVVASGDDATRLILRRRAQALHSELRTAAGAVPELGQEAREGMQAIDDILHRIRTRSGGLTSATLKANWWDQLFDLARSDQAVDGALTVFQDAAASGDAAAITLAARELITRVSRRVSMSKAKAFADRINGAVRNLLAINPTGDGSKTLIALADHIDQLKPGDPARAAFAKLTHAVRDNPDRWFAIANVVAGMKRAASPGHANTMIWRIKGMIGEMLAMSTRAYHDLYKAALADAEALVKRLNSIEPGGWEIITCRTQVRAPVAEGSARLGAFYDDAILVRRVIAGQPEGEAIVVLATQIKSGDWASAGVIKQIHGDLSRELSGRIELNRRLYRLTAAPSEFAPIRVFAGTKLPPPATVAAARLPIRFIIVPMSGDEMHDVGMALLEANKLLP